MPSEYPVGSRGLDELSNMLHIQIVTSQDNVDRYSDMVLTFLNNLFMVLDRSSVKLGF